MTKEMAIMISNILSAYGNGIPIEHLTEDNRWEEVPNADDTRINLAEIQKYRIKPLPLYEPFGRDGMIKIVGTKIIHRTTNNIYVVLGYRDQTNMIITCDGEIDANSLLSDFKCFNGLPCGNEKILTPNIDEQMMEDEPSEELPGIDVGYRVEDQEDEEMIVNEDSEE